MTLPDPLQVAHRHVQAGELAEATALLESLLATQPNHAEALEGIGYIAAKQGDAEKAARFITRAIDAMPNPGTEQLHFAAHLCQHANHHAQAVGHFERLLAKSPAHAESLLGIALSLVRLGDHDRALEHFDRLIRFHPRLAEPHYNKGNLLGMLGRYDDEIAAYRQAIALKPQFVAAHVNLGVALRDLHRFDDALQQFKKAVQIDTNDPGARTNRAQTNLLLGQFEHGWREYEWRWRDGTVELGFDPATQWNGTQAVAGKTVLVHHEQGLGDTLQFVRFIDRLRDAGAQVVLRVQDALLPLLRDYPAATRVIGEHEPVPSFDYHCPTLSLAFALKARDADLAMPKPYLHVDAARRAQWNDVFAAFDAVPDRASKRPRVGIVWSGSTGHLNDRNRSIPLATLAPIFDADADFVSLQKDVRDDDRATLDRLVAQRKLVDVSARLAGFDDTAALIDGLDLVISVDTSVAHLSGALGKPVWIALPFTPDWRWQLGRSDSPWYPTARLFRQTARNDWSNVIEDMRCALQTQRASSDAPR
ncbi:tetratricopeptide repeat-containing glycosyltransferase family protein [Paraburkholderia sp.]|uniref:tetratricopeptide repeat-containing glycosyltransferase family protein n=1 Tax=Paraburkholderia sp. TaxID=1926495 RepID=UPI0023A15DDC|nr:tetratricopeptide repeat-containing glycosyltransferase family protein [Paraburkholderia sp.]MDE1181781.1 tetratricopeptide repeat-containing glycosyltransferase family protein [Paraburkholderia sp.]